MWGMASDMVSRKWRPQIDTPAYECQLKVQEVGSGREEANSLTRRRKEGKRGCLSLQVLASLRLERSGRENHLPGLRRDGDCLTRSREGAKKAGFQMAADITGGSSAPRGRSKSARGNAPRIGAVVVPEP
jgi:hypothetical protein